MTKSWREEHPFWTGFIVGVLGLFAWNHRGAIVSLAKRLLHPKDLLRGLSLAKLGEVTGIEMPSQDPSIAFRQMRRYAFAASQDKSPIVGLTHASYALIALDILEEAVGREALMSKGCDVTKVRAFIAMLQDGHAKRLEACDPYLSSILAMERQQGGTPSSGIAGGIEYSAPTGA